MIRVNLSDGRTMSLDLEDAEDARRWDELRADPSVQRGIRCIEIIRDGRRHALPVPKGFRQIVFEASILRDEARNRVGGEQVICHADQMRMSLTVYRHSDVARFDVRRVGKVRHRPQ